MLKLSPPLQTPHSHEQAFPQLYSNSKQFKLKIKQTKLNIYSNKQHVRCSLTQIRFQERYIFLLSQGDEVKLHVYLQTMRIMRQQIYTKGHLVAHNEWTNSSSSRLKFSFLLLILLKILSTRKTYFP